MSNIGMIMAIVLTGSHWASDANTLQTLVFEQGRVSGFAGCNRLSASFVQEGDHVQISNIALTRKMCNQEKMRQERDWVRRLEAVAGVDHIEGALLLKDDDGRVLARLTQQRG